MRETKQQTRTRAQKIVAKLKKAYPQRKTALEFGNPLQLLIATMLSAQCTDQQVNKVTPGLFNKYPTVKDFAEANPKEFQRDIYSTGFYKNKTKNILACCQTLLETHGGKVPNTMDALVALPGVGRKTANCVLGAAFGIQSGVVVDTHVLRVTGRLVLTRQRDPVKVERDLMVLVRREDWYVFSNMVIQHGRRICHPRYPDCANCIVNKLCPSAFTFPEKLS